MRTRGGMGGRKDRYFEVKLERVEQCQQATNHRKLLDLQAQIQIPGSLHHKPDHKRERRPGPARCQPHDVQRSSSSAPTHQRIERPSGFQWQDQALFILLFILLLSRRLSATQTKKHLLCSRTCPKATLCFVQRPPPTPTAGSGALDDVANHASTLCRGTG